MHVHTHKLYTHIKSKTKRIYSKVESFLQYQCCALFFSQVHNCSMFLQPKAHFYIIYLRLGLIDFRHCLSVLNMASALTPDIRRPEIRTVYMLMNICRNCIGIFIRIHCDIRTTTVPLSLFYHDGLLLKNKDIISSLIILKTKFCDEITSAETRGNQNNIVELGHCRVIA